ncbi:MAG TPA: L-seryl-tRNA(Sec) selenium transferase, partial [Candidatus Dormibacteraeota bacterium]|nr:L-seryl-tRNA(Sec) selenium transferase [Candidatus Dormibacteraeota bacterium]
MRRIRDSRIHRTSSLPAVGGLINEPAYSELAGEFGHERVVQALRDQVAAERDGAAVDDAERISKVGASLRAAVAPRLRHVINASGVILHTNLGRAPLSRAAVDAVRVAAGYSNLELDLDSGRRGERAALLSSLLTQLFGCEAAFVVNNNAAAILLALTALCKGKEVIVSRGQQVEIGGSFRMPDVMRLSGARMVEVGTTNRTRQDDYEHAITARTAALLRVHTSNFRVSGFTESATLAQMAAVAHANDLLLIDDLGSGAAEPIADEPTVAESLQHSDVVTFSGDKLFGGPQAGIVLGRGDSGSAAVKKMSRHPLARAVRIDKLTLAALEATLRQRLTGRLDEIPVERMIRAPVADVRRRAAMWSVKLEERGVRATLVEGISAVGGGSVPGHSIPTVLLAISGPASRLAAALRHGDPPVIARIDKDACCLDP